MPTLVSTGQITIIDQNDAKPITAFIGGSTALQQIHTKNEGVTTHNPNWVSTPLILTAYVYAGGTTNIADSLSDKKWTTSPDGTALANGTGSTYTINTNLSDDAAPVTYYFQGNYTDTNTNLTTKVLTSVVISQVKTGTNAVYVQTRGSMVLEGSKSNTGNVIAIGADLIRSSGIDTTELQYKWYEGGGSTQISKGITNYNKKYNLKTTAAGSSPTATSSELVINGGTDNMPAANAASTYNTLIISQEAVTDFSIFKVDITDIVEAKTYTTFFTVFDTSDPYSLDMVSTGGTIFKNGEGTTKIYPRVFYGGDEIGAVTGTSKNQATSQSADLEGWSFTYTLFDKNNNRAAFIDKTKTAISTGISITSSTAGLTAANNYTFDVVIGTDRTVAAGDLVKLVKPTTLETEFYEVHSSSKTTSPVTTTIKLRYKKEEVAAAPFVGTSIISSGNSWLSWTTAPTADAFKNGILFICRDNNGKITAGPLTSTQASSVTTAIAAREIEVTQHEIDNKGTIFCEASKPL